MRVTSQPKVNEEKKWISFFRYLVLIENGSYTGNCSVLQARDMILAGGTEIARSDTAELMDSVGMDVSILEEVRARKDLKERQKLALLQEKVWKIKC